MKFGNLFKVVALVVALSLASVGLVSAQGTVVAIVPPSEVTYVGGTATVEVWANEVTNFYGAQFALTYDDTIVEGVSIEAGEAFTAFPDEYEVAKAEIGGGVASFAATLLRVPKAGPLTGDVQLAVITFTGLAEGTSPLAFGEVKLSDASGQPIDFTLEGGEIVVTFAPTILTGFAYMEGRTDHSGIEVTLQSDPPVSTFTDASGAYSFEGMAGGVYSLTMSADLYLSAMAVDVEVIEHESNTACDVTLLGGDLNNDEVIDILDLSMCAAHFETADPEADVNADGVVDVYDLVLLGKNFKLEGPTVFSCAPVP